MIVKNITTMSGILLMGFSDNHELQILHALLLLVTYLLGSAGNFIIITITTLDPQLQSPMYYFLKHLSLLDLSSLSVTVPQYVDSSLTRNGYISYGQCMMQVFSFIVLAWNELAILTVMSYDCYVAICLPLHYEVIMDPRKCTWAVTAVWLSGSISGTLYTASTLSIRFCGDKIIHQFFCDVPQLLKLSCSKDHLVIIGMIDFLSVIAFACFIGIIISYVHIFSTVLRMPSAESRSKVFSTCLPHLFVFSLFLSSGACAYLNPTSDSPTALEFLFSVFYAVIPPTLNPLIYSLRNETIKSVVRKLLFSTKFTG
ncbi:olfactory receptor Olr1710 [Rattus norvegicus]|uniref:Olfactory receptor family 14 subfamily J member 3B n=1 Tax=Rattus norvegicus TaxID=10116 RepID=M0R7F9_RAT|nr:olfactory receptor Olr1710 [Rattus norvegicus]|eukprot:NP_001000886.1 olfactory receptor Olr1710 [Rattus norvegicus]